MFFIGRNYFGESGFDNYRTQIPQSDYTEIEMNDIMLDEIFVDNSATIPITTDKPTQWNFTTVLNAKFQGNLEGGSLQAQEEMIEKIRFYKCRKDTSEWIAIGETDFDAEDGKIYKIYDKIIRNGFEYQYSVAPVTNEIRGNRVTSDYKKVQFEGCFLSDRNNNYMFIYNLDEGVITHNTSVAEFKPINTQFPITVTDISDYKSGGVNLVYYYGDVNSVDEMSISMEYMARDNVMKFLKDGKPKFIKFDNGESMIISVTGSPTESRIDGGYPISNISFNYVEIDDITTESVIRNGFYQDIEVVNINDE